MQENKQEQQSELKVDTHAGLVDLYIFDPSVNTINAGEYYGSPDLKTVHLGPQVRLVQQGAFASCPNLEYIEYTSPLTKFEKYCFNNDKKINTIHYKTATFYLQYFPSDRAYFMGVMHEQRYGISLYTGHFYGADVLLSGKPSKDEAYYLAVITKGEKKYSWFSTDPNLAVVSTKFKASGKSFHDFFEIDLTLDTPVAWPQLQILIGVCDQGYLLWELLCSLINHRPTDDVPLGEILNALGDSFPMVTDRIMTMVKKQNEVFNWLNYDELYSGVLFYKQIILFLQKNKERLINDTNNQSTLVKYLRKHG